MGEVIVIYDKDKEVAAIVDVDNRRGYGPALIGPDSATLLEGFVASMPYDITQVDSYTLIKWFEQYIGAVTGGGTPPAISPSTGEMEPAGHTDVGEGRAAEREAVAESAAPPPEQPADTDTPQDTGEAAAVADGSTAPQDPNLPPPQAEPLYEGKCWNCSGTRMVPGPNGPVTCQVCKGTGQLPAPETTTA